MRCSLVLTMPRGNITESAYYGLDGKPALHKDGYARSTRAYDARGNLIEESFFGLDGKLILQKNGYARLTRSFDARGSVIEETYFDITGSPVHITGKQSSCNPETTCSATPLRN